MKIATKLAALFLALSVIPLAVVGVMAFENGRRALEAEARERLMEVNELREADLDRWIQDDAHWLGMLAQRPGFSSYAAALASFDETSPEYRAAYEAIHEDPAWAGEEGTFGELFLLRASDGRILAATERTLEGEYREGEPYFVEGGSGTYIGEVGYFPGHDEPAMHISTPVYDSGGECVAVLVGHADLAEMNTIMQQGAIPGSSEETYLVNASNLLVTGSRFQPGAPLTEEVHTAGIEDCLAHHSGFSIYDDYRGVRVLGVYRWLPERELCIVTEADQAEAFAPAAALRNTVLAIGAGVALIAALAGVLLSRSITRPVNQLVRGAEEIGRGNLEYRIAVRGKDEIAQLAGAFNDMAEKRRQADEALRRSERALSIRDQIATAFLTGSEEEMYHEVLNIILEIMQSQYGVLGYINDDGALVVPSMTWHIWDRCQVPDKTITFPRDTWGDSSWPRPIREKKTIYSNEASSNIPKGHIEIQRHISLPILSQGEVVGLIQVANKETDYTQADIRLLETTGEYLGSILSARLQRERVERALRTSEERLQYLVSSSPAVIYTSKPYGDYGATFISENAGQLLGYKPEEFIEDPGFWADRIHPEDAPRVMAELSALFEHGHHTHEYRFLHKDGTYRWMRDELRLLRDADGQPLETIGCWIDITERKRAEQELEAFAYSVSHDLRAPLRAMDGFSRILVEEYAPQLPDEAGRYLRLVRDNAQHMGKLIDDLLTFSRLGRQPLKTQSVMPADLAREALEDLRAVQGGRKVKITIGDLPACRADPALLRQVFANLLGNALKFTRERKRAVIEVGCQQSDGACIYYVKDNGVGFDMRYVDKLFGVFQRLHSAAEYEGTGVGLATVQRIIHRHGGRIWAEAEVGHGATFFFTIGGGTFQ